MHKVKTKNKFIINTTFHIKFFTFRFNSLSNIANYNPSLFDPTFMQNQPRALHNPPKNLEITWNLEAEFTQNYYSRELLIQEGITQLFH